ncbi:methyltransferase family protein [Burkholderia pseudomallei]|nr:methyltransferase family protein [Burkholderia pseudomallei]
MGRQPSRVLHSHASIRSLLRLSERRDVPGPFPSRTVPHVAQLRERARRRPSEGARPAVPLPRSRLRLRAFDRDQRGGISACRISRLRFQSRPYRSRRAAREPARHRQRRVPRGQLRRAARSGSAAVRLHRDARHLQLGRRRRAPRDPSIALAPARRRGARLPQLQLPAGLGGRGAAAQADARARAGGRRRHRGAHGQRDRRHAQARHAEPALLPRQSGRRRGARRARERSARLPRARIPERDVEDPLLGGRRRRNGRSGPRVRGQRDARGQSPDAADRPSGGRRDRGAAERAAAPSGRGFRRQSPLSP